MRSERVEKQLGCASSACLELLQRMGVLSSDDVEGEPFEALRAGSELAETVWMMLCSHR